MKALIQRVSEASVSVEGQSIASIQKGLLVFIGITSGDGPKDIEYLKEKILNLRIFEGESGKLDLSVLDLKGEILLVSQFTLYGTCDKGRRPDFAQAAPIEEARLIYEQVVASFQKSELKIEQGQFQAHMQVKLCNDGPVTLMLESKK